MDIRKLILSVLLLFLLNFTVPMGGQILISKEKSRIVFVISSDDNDNVSNLIKENKKIVLSTFVSLTLRIYLIDRQYAFFNSS